MDLANYRHVNIMELLNDNSFITVKELSSQLNVSLVTIRKDLSILEKEGYLYRMHGGASKKDRYAFDRSVVEKEKIQISEKKKIAKMAASLVSENDFLILGSGTSINCLAQELIENKNLTVCTPSLGTSLILAENPLVTIIQLGGELRKSSRSVVGSMADKTIRQFSAHILFLGIDGIDMDFGISTSNAAEAQLNQAMIEQSDKVIVLADDTKINKKGFGKIADLDVIDVLITNDPIDSDFQKALEEKGVEVITV